jgi:hypothetical protein
VDRGRTDLSVNKAARDEIHRLIGGETQHQARG